MQGLSLAGKLELPEKEKRSALISPILRRKLLGNTLFHFPPPTLPMQFQKSKDSYSIVQKSAAILRKFNPIALHLVWRNKQEKFKSNISSDKCGNFLLPICQGNEHFYQA